MRIAAVIPVLAAAGCSTAPIAGIMDHIDKHHDRRGAIERSRPTAASEPELPPEPTDATPVRRTPPRKSFDPERKLDEELREADREAPPPRRPTLETSAPRPKPASRPEFWDDDEPIPQRRGPAGKAPASDEREYR